MKSIYKRHLVISLILWISTISIIYILTRNIDTNEPNRLDDYQYLRFVFPMLIVFFELIYIEMSKPSDVVLKILSLPFIVLGTNWLMIFVTTTYRSGQREVVIPVAVFFILLAIVLLYFPNLKFRFFKSPSI